MNLAHLSDCHLGYRRYERTAPSHLNQREEDVANAFRQAVDAILAAAPAVVVIAGDLFHMPMPRNAAICFAAHQLKRLRDAGIPVLAIAGNHDTGRSNEWNSVFPLFRDLLGVDIAISDPMEFSYPALDLCITAVPDTALRRGERDALKPHGDAKYRVLVLHGEVEGLYRKGRNPERESAPISAANVASEEWSYIAIGDYHVQHQVGPRAWYSGSTEYTSSDIWSEVKKEGTPGKGWLLVDLDTGKAVRQPLSLARMIHDLPLIDAEGQTAAQIDDLLSARMAAVPGGIRGAIVRIKLLNLSIPIHREINTAAIRQWKGEALDLHVDIRRPEMIRTVGGAVYRLREPLEEKFRRYLGDFPLPPGMDRERFVATGVELLASTEDSPLERDRKARGAA